MYDRGQVILITLPVAQDTFCDIYIHKSANRSKETSKHFLITF
jgi:hypothetical protein